MSTLGQAVPDPAPEVPVPAVPVPAPVLVPVVAAARRVLPGVTRRR